MDEKRQRFLQPNLVITTHHTAIWRYGVMDETRHRPFATKTSHYHLAHALKVTDETGQCPFATKTSYYHSAHRHKE